MAPVLALSCSREARPAVSGEPVSGGWPASRYRPVDQPVGWDRHGRLVYVHEEEYRDGDVAERVCGRSGVYATDGRSPPRPLITGAEWCRHGIHAASLAGDGRTLVAAPDGDALSDQYGEVLAADLETGRWRSLARFADTYVNGPALSPDGQRMAGTFGCHYVEGGAHQGHFLPLSCRDWGEGVFVAELRTGARTRVTPKRQDVLGWVGNDAVLVMDSAGLARVDLATRRRTALVAPRYASVSLRGEWMAYVLDGVGDSASALAVARTDGSAARVLWRNAETGRYSNGWGQVREGEPWRVLWTPDGRGLVFSRTFANGVTLWRVNLDGGGPRPMAPRLEPGPPSATTR